MSYFASYVNDTTMILLAVSIMLMAGFFNDTFDEAGQITKCNGLYRCGHPYRALRSKSNSTRPCQQHGLHK